MGFPIQLACVKPAPSVHPEPGSNSLVLPRFLFEQHFFLFLSFYLLEFIIKHLIKGIYGVVFFYGYCYLFLSCKPIVPCLRQIKPKETLSNLKNLGHCF